MTEAVQAEIGPITVESKGKDGGLERHYTTAEVAKYLGVLPVTVRRWIRSGRLRAVRVVREIRIPASAVAEILTDAREIPEGLREQGELIGKTAKERARKRRQKASKSKPKRGRKGKG